MMPLDVASILSPGGAIAQHLPGFEPRPQQVQMALAVQRALNSDGRLLVEAGTGVGKSFAYLAPAIKRVVEHHERVVIATNTINLQEQLIEKDIPLLSAAIPEKFSAVLVKGRGNYVSLRRLKLASERQAALFSGDEALQSLHIMEDWAYETRDGSLSTLPQLPRPEVWDYAQSDTHNCMGKRCPTYDKCFYQAARRRMENGDLLICNHALFFADLALRMHGVGFLPPYDHVILDEAHHVEDVAAEHFGVSLSQAQVAHLLNLLYQPQRQRGFLATLRLKDGSTEAVEQAISAVGNCRDVFQQFFGAVGDWLRTSGPSNGRVAQADFVANTLTEPLKALGAMLRLLKQRAATEPDAFELNSYAQRAYDLANAAEMLVGQRIEGCVYWVESAQRGAGRRVSLHCMPIEVGPILRERLFGMEDTSIVMTSATLVTSRGDFTHIASRLGCESADTLQLGSPFDHASQVQLFVERDLPEPNDRQFIARLCPRIMHHLLETDGGAFVLFTSFAMIRQAAEHLRPELERRDHPVLVQGDDGPPGQLLKRFREDERSVLFGTNSFWHGVDVRGRGLRNVIITRLPFEVPDRPLVEARRELIEARGGNSFAEDQLPRAVIRFRQGFGRLIRSATDTGRVVVLDPRFVTKSYGRVFLAALPEGVRIEDTSIVEDGSPSEYV